MTPDNLAVLLVAILGTGGISGAFAAWLQSRKSHVEKLRASAAVDTELAETHKSLAEGTGEWLDQFKVLFERLQEREALILNLRMEVNDLKLGLAAQGTEIESLKLSLKDARSELEAERSLRLRAEQERDMLQQQVAHLTKEVEQLRMLVNQLRGETP